jgi:hypothetical protein
MPTPNYVSLSNAIAQSPNERGFLPRHELLLKRPGRHIEKRRRRYRTHIGIRGRDREQKRQVMQRVHVVWCSSENRHTDATQATYTYMKVVIHTDASASAPKSRDTIPSAWQRLSEYEKQQRSPPCHASIRKPAIALHAQSATN